jgi:hypothetical protein
MSTPVIKQGAQGEYYEVGGYKYAGTFPYEWAIDHKWHTEIEDCGSGPEWCGNCRADGSINGVFVFYCANCVSYIYDDESYPKRNGELFLEDIETDEDLWEACPYMRGISLSQIGDKPVASEVENQDLTERQLERARYWARRERYWDAYYDENGRSIFDEGFREPVEEKPTSHEDEDRFFSYYAADNVIQREIEGQKLREFNERQLQMAQENVSNNFATVQAQEEEYEYEYEAYRDNDDYYDQWDEPYSDEYPITRRELLQVPPDMRAAFDPEYQTGLANFRAAAMEK